MNYGIGRKYGQPVSHKSSYPLPTLNFSMLIATPGLEESQKIPRWCIFSGGCGGTRKFCVYVCVCVFLQCLNLFHTSSL